MQDEKHTTDDRVWWVRLLAALAVIAALALSSTAILAALNAGLGLLALGVLCVAGFFGLRALPLLGKRWEAQLLRSRMLNAKSDPIEELAQQVVARTSKLMRDRESLTSISAQITCLRELLASSPQEDVAKQSAVLERMVAFHQHYVQKLREDELSLAEDRQRLIHKRFEWEFAEAGKRVLSGLHAHDRAGIVSQLASDEATRAIELRFAEVTAALEMEPLLPANRPKALKAGLR